ncbi:MAG: hypothetical protein R3C44_24675 [Chloroflexota bacterium]
MTGEVESAETLLTDAIAYYEQIGDLVRSEEMRTILGTAYVNIRQYDKAIPPTEQALTYLRRWVKLN